MPKSTLVNEIAPYDVIGELSVLYGQKRAATAVALEESELMVLEREAFEATVKVGLWMLCNGLI